MLTYPYCGTDQYSNMCCDTRTLIESCRNGINVAPVMSYNPLLIGLLNAYVSPKPKSGRKVYKDLGDCWIVIAYEIGPLKLLELELK